MYSNYSFLLERWSPLLLNAVWEKAPLAHVNNKLLDPNVWRLDITGRLIKRSHYGLRASKYGWEVDHIKPKSLGGKDRLRNFQPLHWKVNLMKSNQYPWVG